MLLLKSPIHQIKVEPYWNVNGIKHLGLLIIGLIKVEPYWNVNGEIRGNKLIFNNIKVEPYWNVNSTFT